MKYLQKSFSSSYNSDEYRDGWDSCFKDKEKICNTLTKCRKCKCIFQYKEGFMTCPKCKNTWAEFPKNGSEI